MSYTNGRKPSLPVEMGVITFANAGGPEVIRPARVPVPEPGPGKVLIEVVAFGINRGDCMQRSGVYPPPPGESAVPGLEVAGRVVALGSGVSSPKIGEDVCVLVGSGGYAEYCVADAVLCMPRPSGFSFVQAAALPEAAFTVFDNVFTRGKLVRGETFLVHGGSSGIGSTAIQYAKHFGATVIATAGSEEKCDFCKSIGADAQINYKEADFSEEVARFTQGRGVDLILDSIGGPYFQKNIALLAVEGRLVQINFMQGSVIENFNYQPVLAKRLTLTGSSLRSRPVAQKLVLANAVRNQIWPLYESSTLQPHIHTVFPMEQIRKAHELMESSRHLGKIIVTTGH